MKSILEILNTETPFDTDLPIGFLVHDTSSGIIYQLLQSATDTQTLNDVDKTIIANDISDTTKDRTGFVDPAGMEVHIDYTERTATITGNVKGLYQGVVVPELIDTWVSEPYPDGATETQFLMHDGTTAEWHSGFDFTKVLITVVFPTLELSLRECHGLLPHLAHEIAHLGISTLKTAGGTFDDFVLNSTTAADRRPTISTTSLLDEDLPTILEALTSDFTQFNLTGTGDATFTVDQLDVIPLDGNRPYYNEFDGTNWGQTLFPTNAYGKIFVMAIPVTNDAITRKKKYAFIQPQTVSTDINEIRNLLSNTVNLGELNEGLAEYNYIGEIIVRWQANNWTYIEVNELSGSRANQISSPAGNFLTVVNSDATLEGLGTTSDPLSWSGAGAGVDDELIKVAADGKTASRTGVFVDAEKNISELKDTSTETVTIDAAVKMEYDSINESLKFNFL